MLSAAIYTRITHAYQSAFSLDPVTPGLQRYTIVRDSAVDLFCAPSGCRAGAQCAPRRIGGQCRVSTHERLEPLPADLADGRPKLGHDRYRARPAEPRSLEGCH